MALKQTQLKGRDVGDGSIGRADLNVTLAGEAVIRKMIDVASSGVKISSYTGVDSGTGDVGMTLDWTLLGTTYSGINHTHAYLPLTGGTLTGNLNILKNDGNPVGASLYNTNATGASRLFIGASITETTFGALFQYDNSDNSLLILNRKATTGTVALNTTGGGLSIANTGAATFIGTDGTGNRNTPFNTLTIQTDNPSFPYNGFGGGILFKDRSYTSGIVTSARIRSRIENDGGTLYGASLIFEVNPTTTGSLTPALTLGYNGAATFSSSVTATSAKLSDRLEITSNTNSWASSPCIVFTPTSGNANTRRWFVGAVDTDYGNFVIGNSTTPTDNPYNPKLTITKEGNATFSGSIAVASDQGNTNDFNILTWNNLSPGYGDWTLYKTGNNDIAFGYGTSDGSTKTAALKLEYGGAATFSSSVKAYSVTTDSDIKTTGYFESVPNYSTYGAWNMRMFAQASTNCYNITGGGYRILETEGYSVPYSVFLYSNNVKTLSLTNSAATFSGSVTATGLLTGLAGVTSYGALDMTWKDIIRGGNATFANTVTANHLVINSVYDGIYTQAAFCNPITATTTSGKGVAITLGHTEGSYYSKIATVFESQNPDYLRPALAFYTMGSSYLAGSEVERMRINSDGNIAMYQGLSVTGSVTAANLILNTYVNGGVALINPAGSYARLSSFSIANGVHHAVLSINGIVNPNTNGWMQDNASVPSWMIVLNATDDILQINVVQQAQQAQIVCMKCLE